MIHNRVISGSTLILYLMLWVGSSSCKHNRLDVDVSKIPIAPVHIQRFDRDFFDLNADNIVKKLPQLQKKYPGFTELFVKNILCPSGLSDNSCIPEITRFVVDKDMRSAYMECQKVFPNMNVTETKLTNAFRHYKYYFPHTKPPIVIALMSGFNYSIITADTVLGVCLERYLGSNNRFYDMLQLPKYQRGRMQKEFIANDVVHTWMTNVFPNNNRKGTLLNEMIYQGKLLYITQAMMPKEQDTITIGFTKKQLDWCIDNERNMWGYLIKNKFLYSNDINVVTKFTGEAPFTTGFVKDSPGRSGIWIGWQIVKTYMDNNPDITLTQLMAENNAQKILVASTYKP